MNTNEPTGGRQMRRWDVASVAFLREHYPDRGPAWVADRLGRGRKDVSRKAGDLRVRWRGPDPEEGYRRALDALRADAAAHGRPGPTRVARALGLAVATVEHRLAEARRRGDLPPARPSSRAADAPEGDAEPGESERAGIARRMEAERARKESAVKPWTAPEVRTRR